ncbi:MAG: hypothetical protein JXA58_07960, partial [Dehalococcoidia bacterium]|nr:hypothetical protein [Dehalococcoidia bacterium]
VLETPAQSDSPLHEQWRTAITATDTAVETASAGHAVFTSDGAILEILHPPDQLLTGTSDDLDNNGTVLRVTYGEVSFLLAADIRAETEQYLVRRLGSQLRSDVLKVAHHGSSTSSTREFIAAVQPCTAVISVGEDNPYGHPDSDVVGLLEDMQADVLITSQSGTIEFITDGSELWVKTERGRPTTS